MRFGDLGLEGFRVSGVGLKPRASRPEAVFVLNLLLEGSEGLCK